MVFEEFRLLAVLNAAEENVERIVGAHCPAAARQVASDAGHDVDFDADFLTELAAEGFLIRNVLWVDLSTRELPASCEVRWLSAASRKDLRLSATPPDDCGGRNLLAFSHD
jgi:hypothetical protein